MNAIRKFQSVAGTGNPVYITDVTYPTELINMLGSALNNFGRAAYIISGFNASGANAFTPGIVWFNGEVYAFEGGSVPSGQYLFAGTRQADTRVAESGETYNAYSENFLFTATTNTSPNGTLVDSDPVSAAMVNKLKAPPMQDGFIKGNHFAPSLLEGRATTINCEITLSVNGAGNIMYDVISIKDINGGYYDQRLSFTVLNGNWADGVRMKAALIGLDGTIYNGYFTGMPVFKFESYIDTANQFMHATISSSSNGPDLLAVVPLARGDTSQFPPRPNGTKCIFYVPITFNTVG